MLSLKKNLIQIRGRYDASLSVRENLLHIRGLELSPAEERTFFAPDFSDLHDPFILPGMRSAVDRILLAREQKERVVIFGDYDVDGVSSTALLVRFFHEQGWQVSYRLPHRVKDGYGLKPYFIDELHEKQVKLVITVDCGTRDVESIRYARSLGIDMIVTDHHAIPDEIPEGTIALINPKDPTSEYPFSHLSGSGVAFKLLSAVAHHIAPSKEAFTEMISSFIDFAALGTIADCMPLIGENRTIAALGLKQLKQSKSDGLRRLIEWDMDKDLDGDVVGFRIGPRINAAGRMDTPYKALQMLLASEDRLDEVLSDIEDLNTKRKTMTDRFARHALANVDESRHIIVYDSTEIEHGIIGLIAGRLCEAYHKPTIALKDEGDRLVASCRSPEYFNMVGFLEPLKDYFVAFWGHRQAAGFSILKERFAEFLIEIEQKAALLLSDRPENRTLQVDAELPVESVSLSMVREISAFKPFWLGNPKPLFLIRGIATSGMEYLGKDQKHLRFKISQSGVSSKAFGFWEFYELIRESATVSLIVELEENSWNGRVTVDLNVKDILLP